MTDEERVKAYLKEIAEVSKRHGLFIYSCDCCSTIVGVGGKEVPNSLDYSGIKYNLDKDSY